MAREARNAQNSGQLVRAYLLYAEASARDPGNPTYRANREALAPVAQLLTKAQVENADISADVKAAAAAPADFNPGPPIELASERDWERSPDLQPIPHLDVSASIATFNTRGDEKALFQEVAAAYGIHVIFDPELQPQQSIRFQIDQADCRTAMEALTAVTHTFVFPVSRRELFVAQDTELKRSELEPNVLLTFPLPNALDQNQLIEAANAVRGVLTLRAIGWDSATRTVMIRDRVSRARIARSLLEAVLLPRGQVSIEVQFLSLDSEASYHYGASLPTTFQLLNIGASSALHSALPAITTAANFLTFGGGASLFGLGIGDSTIFATYARSFTRLLYDATVVIGDGQTANFHVGDKYPIPQSIYTGFQQTSSSIYNPIGQITLEDLGLILKLTPHIDGEEEVSLNVESNYKSLGTQTYNTVPAINEREFKGSVILREGQWAILAGMNSDTQDVTRTGLEGLSRIPGLNQILSENTRDTQMDKILLVIKPVITRLPISGSISPQYFLGPLRGESVLF